MIKSTIPKNWESIRFSKIMEIDTRNGISKSVSLYGNGFKLLRMTEFFKEEVIDTNQEMERVPASDSELDRFKLKKDDLLFARRSLNIEGAGKCGIISSISEPILFESSLIRVRLDKNKALPYYIMNYLNNTVGRREINKIIRVLAISGITGTDLKKTKILLPPLTEQQKIVSILENVDNLIQTTQQLIEKLEIFKKGLMQRLFMEGIGHTEFKDTKLGRIPKEWKLTRIRNHIESLISGNWGEDPIKGQHSYPVLRSTEISHLGKLRNLENAERRFLSSEQIEKYHLRKNDILIVSSSGSPHLIGRACFFDISDSNIYCFSNFLFRLRTKGIEPNYLYNFMKSSHYERELLRLQQTATGLRNLRKDDLKSILLPLPSDEEQKQIIKKIDVIDKIINLERVYLIKIREIKKGLMQVLLTGKKRI